MPSPKITYRQRFVRTIYFFPFQLVVVYLKKNHLLLLFWILLFGLVSQAFGVKYGLPYLFLYPEYMGEVNFFSHMLLGFACGIFIMAFNISSYIINGFRFPLIATLSRPFIKFCINNCIIPSAFVLVYIYNIYQFQHYQELENLSRVVSNIAGFISGNLIFILFSLLYFFTTNKSLPQILGVEKDKPPKKTKSKKTSSSPVKDILHKKEKWYNIFNRDREWRVETYLTGLLNIGLARDSSHYDRNMLKNVFNQNHVNASLFEFVIIVAILTLGLFNENPVLFIPAGASVFLLFSIFIMLGSALHSWLKGWATAALIGLVVLVNFASKNQWLNYNNYAYGMDYTVDKADYSAKNLIKIQNNKEDFRKDYQESIQVLENWKKQNSINGEKPKLIFINASGGGLRSAMWTMRSLQYADSISGGKLLSHSHLISGSSGGMIGAAYLRELYLKGISDSSFNYHSSKYTEQIGKDLLNPVAFNIAVHDMYLRIQSFKDGKYTYPIERGYAFEQQLHKNTDSILQKRLGGYSQSEKEGIVPSIILTPTIADDGRKMVISSRKISYLCYNLPENNFTSSPITECIEFSRFFEKQNANNLHYSTALRMSSTFPYIMPSVSLPSEPSVEMMDAGIRDNYGLVISVKYLYTFRKWIAENTSGVIILQVRDKPKLFNIMKTRERGIFSNMLSPLGSFYSNWAYIQTYDQDQLLQYASSWFKGNLDLITLQLNNSEEDRISLSWHLTGKEKQAIRTSVLLPKNIQAMHTLKKKLENTAN